MRPPPVPPPMGKISESDQHSRCSARRDFAAIRISPGYWRFFNLIEVVCKNHHKPRTIVKTACWICPKIVLDINCFKINDQPTYDRWTKKRKLSDITVIWPICISRCVMMMLLCWYKCWRNTRRMFTLSTSWLQNECFQLNLSFSDVYSLVKKILWKSFP